MNYKEKKLKEFEEKFKPYPTATKTFQDIKEINQFWSEVIDELEEKHQNYIDDRDLDDLME